MSMSTKEVVAAIKSEFRGFDRPLYVKATNPDRYGVQLIKRAQEIADGKPPSKPHKHDKAGCPYRLSCRVTKEQYEAVHRAKERHGCTRMADYLITIILKALEVENEV